MEKNLSKLLMILCLSISAIAIHSTETQLVLRAKAKDAKFIGSSIGGAYFIVRNSLTQNILAEGISEGGTGNTNLIMTTPKTRNMTVADDHTAKFLATIDIDVPTFVRIDAFAPFNHKQARVHASTEIWIIPGKHILGDGIILEIPGFIIDILTPKTHQFINMASISRGMLEVQANIVMMCGCTISEGGLWNASDMEVNAILRQNNLKIEEIPLDIQSPNLFTGKIQIPNPGNYELTVYAFHEKTGNTGVDQVNYVVE